MPTSTVEKVLAEFAWNDISPPAAEVKKVLAEFAWTRGAPVAVVPDISGAPTVLATFDGSGSEYPDYYAWEWTSLPGGSALSNFPKPLPDNAVGSLMADNEGLYHFEGNADDSSGNARNGTVSNAVQVTGKVGSNAYEFVASSSAQILLGATTDYHFTTESFTIAGWYKPGSSQGSWVPLFSCLGGGAWDANARGYWIDQSSSSTNTYRWGIRAGGSPYYGSNFTLPADEWSHVCAVRSGATFKVYVNGTEVTSDTLNATIEQASNGSALAIGRHGTDYPALYYWNGDIDEFAIWSRALSPAEVTEVYDQGAKTGLGISTATATFTPDVVGTYTVQLTVADGVSVTADAVIAAAGGGGLSPANLAPASLAPDTLSPSALSPK